MSFPMHVLDLETCFHSHFKIRQFIFSYGHSYFNICPFPSQLFPKIVTRRVETLPITMLYIQHRSHLDNSPYWTWHFLAEHRTSNRTTSTRLRRPKHLICFVYWRTPSTMTLEEHQYISTLPTYFVMLMSEIIGLNPVRLLLLIFITICTWSCECFANLQWVRLNNCSFCNTNAILHPS